MRSAEAAAGATRRPAEQTTTVCGLPSAASPQAKPNQGFGEAQDIVVEIGLVDRRVLAHRRCDGLLPTGVPETPGFA
jgi:hypothetical protein